MPIEVNDKLVVAISSRALFNLDDSHRVFEEDGLQAYLEHPLHLELVGAWRPKVDQFRIFDVGKTSIGR